MTKPSNNKKSTEEKIKAAYTSYVQENQDHPIDTFSFCATLNLSEVEFFNIYEGLEEVHSEIWADFMISTLTALADDPQFVAFGGREQLLSFFYTHIEILKDFRPFILVNQSRMKVPIPLPRFLVDYKRHFMDFAQKLVAYSMDTEEIADRKFLNKQYQRGLWTQLYWLLQFWTKDESADFETTDAAIEKAVNLSFELARPGPFDSMIDFAKFIYQNR